MATRPNTDLKNAIIKTFVAGGAISANRLLKFGSADTEAVHAAANERGFAISLEAAASGARVQVCLLGGQVAIPVKVGTGGATRGQFLVNAADGVTDAGTLGGGTTLKNVVGEALQSGAAGDVIAMLPAPAAS